ncbi:Nucleoside hydrolase 5 [Linum perenne]
MQKNSWLVVIVLNILLISHTVDAKPKRVLVDTDVDTEDLLALLYLLKLNRSNIAVEAVTISANSWSDAGHAVNQIYDILHMMDRDDVSIGVGGEGGVLDDGTFLPNVGGYLPLIEQGMTTAGSCRYRQTIPVGQGGRLDIDSNFGIRRAFLPQVVIHSGVPITLVPLDATDTVPVHKEFFEMFEKKQETLEAQYCFKSLKMARDTWPDDQFYLVISLFLTKVSIF